MRSDHQHKCDEQRQPVFLGEQLGHRPFLLLQHVLDRGNFILGMVFAAHPVKDAAGFLFTPGRNEPAGTFRDGKEQQ